jgi:hypothetical protein
VDASTDRVGIGTNSPATKLDVNIGTSGRFRFTDSSGTLVDHINPAADAFVASYQRAASYGWGVGSTLPPTSMVLDSSGNVGIGTSSPAYKLDVVSTSMRIASGTTGVGYVQYGNSATATQNWHVGTEGDGTYRFWNGNFGSGSERMRIDSSGNVGIGVTPSAWATVRGLQIGLGASLSGNTTTSIPDLYLSANAYYNGSAWKYITADYACQYDIRGNEGIHLWSIAGTGSADANITWTEAMRITSGGVLLCGYTSPGNPVAGVIGATGFNIKAGQSGALGGSMFNIDWTGSPQLWIDTTNVGTLATTSDYRTKRNIVTQEQAALERITQLRPVTYQRADYGTLFQSDNVVREGFIAHELAEVIPSAVEGEKDAEDQIQSLKLDALCSVMVKAIQELKAELDTVKAELATLKG